MFQGQVDAGYCPLCLYSSQSHLMLNNHVRLHFLTSMVCGMADCWYVSHSAESMWKHAAEHGLATAEPIAQTKHGKKKLYRSVPILNPFLSSTGSLNR